MICVMLISMTVQMHLADATNQFLNGCCVRILRDGAWDGQPTGGSRECEGFHSPGIISAAKAVPRKTEQAQGQGPMKAPAAQLLGGDDKEKEMKKLQKKRNQRN